MNSKFWGAWCLISYSFKAAPWALAQFLTTINTPRCFCGCVTFDLLLLDAVQHYRKTQMVLSHWKSSPISKVAPSHVRWVKKIIAKPTSHFTSFLLLFLLITVYSTRVFLWSVNTHLNVILSLLSLSVYPVSLVKLRFGVYHGNGKLIERHRWLFKASVADNYTYFSH